MPDRRIGTLRELNPGDHIRMSCQNENQITKKKKKAYSVDHHALVIQVVNNSQLCVIHNDGVAVVEETETFHPGQLMVVEHNPDDCFSADQAIRRARSKLGERWDLLWNNCEHFVNWAKTGIRDSSQVKKGAALGMAGAASGVAAGAAIGSVVPVVGTVIGAGVGGVLGGVGAVSMYMFG